MSLNIADMESSVGELSRNYLYKIYIEKLPTSTLFTASDWTGFTTNVDLYNKKAVFPERKTADITVKWAGQNMHVSGVDESPKSTTLSFMDDESMKIYDFFTALQELSGTENGHVAATSAQQNFNIGIAQVSVDKDTILLYRRLKEVKVLGVKRTDADKTSDGLNDVDVSIVWNFSEEDSSKRGKSA